MYMYKYVICIYINDTQQSYNSGTVIGNQSLVFA